MLQDWHNWPRSWLCPTSQKMRFWKLQILGVPGYFNRLPLTQGSPGELVIGWSISFLVGTQLYITPIQVEWPKLCMLQVVPWTWTDSTVFKLEARVWIIQPKKWSNLGSDLCNGICSATFTHNHSCHQSKPTTRCKIWNLTNLFKGSGSGLGFRVSPWGKLYESY